MRIGDRDRGGRRDHRFDRIAAVAQNRKRALRGERTRRDSHSTRGTHRTQKLSRHDLFPHGQFGGCRQRLSHKRRGEARDVPSVAWESFRRAFTSYARGVRRANSLFGDEGNDRFRATSAKKYADAGIKYRRPESHHRTARRLPRCETKISPTTPPAATPLNAWSGPEPAFSGRFRAGFPKSLGLLGTAEAAQAIKSPFTFMQISDSHVGFNKGGQSARDRHVEGGDR